MLKHLIKLHYKELKVYVFCLPYNKEWISIHVKGLNFSMIVLKNDLHEPSISSIDYRPSNFRCSFERPCGKIKRVNTLKLILIGKP